MASLYVQKALKIGISLFISILIFTNPYVQAEMKKPPSKGEIWETLQGAAKTWKSDREASLSLALKSAHNDERISVRIVDKGLSVELIKGVSSSMTTALQESIIPRVPSKEAFLDLGVNKLFRALDLSLAFQLLIKPVEIKDKIEIVLTSELARRFKNIGLFGCDTPPPDLKFWCHSFWRDAKDRKIQPGVQAYQK